MGNCRGVGGGGGVAAGATLKAPEKRRLWSSIQNTCPPPPPQGGNHHLGPESIGNTRRQRRQREFLQGAKADLHCDTMVQICGAVAPPGGGTVTLCPPPPPQGGDQRDKRGEISRGGGYKGIMEWCPKWCWPAGCASTREVQRPGDLWEWILMEQEARGLLGALTSGGGGQS